MEDGLRGPPSRGRGPHTLKPARERGIRPSEPLENNDAQGSLQALGDSVISGPMLRHEFGLLRAAHGARTAMRTDRRHEAATRHGASRRAAVGRASGAVQGGLVSSFK